MADPKKTAKKDTGQKGEKQKKTEQNSSAKRCCSALTDAGISVRDVAWKCAASKSFACGVAPGAVEGTICTDEFEVDAGGEGSKGVTARKHVIHICHVCGIKR